MKNVSSLKSTKTESPKTPGGISKSLLTPCRRVGLSRNWKKAGPSPFVSPLSGSNSSVVEKKVEKKQPRKRKKDIHDEDEEQMKSTPETSDTNSQEVESSEFSASSVVVTKNITDTPTRHVELPRKKKSKGLVRTLSKNKKENNLDEEMTTKVEQDKNISEETEKDAIGDQVNQNVSLPIQKSKSKVTLHKQKSKSKSKLTEALTKIPNNTENVEETDIKQPKEAEIVNNENSNDIPNIKTRSPNKLAKECIVVIQKKIFKTNDKKIKEDLKSQTLFDSDSDDVPLCKLNTNKTDKIENSKPLQKVQTSKEQEIINLDEDDDFIENKSKIKKLEDKATSVGGLKKKAKKEVKTVKKTSITPLTPLSQNSEFDDDEDFDLGNRKTSLIRKTYVKTSKPQKAKSTGSITQRDIDELKARIESKKKLLLAKAMTEDTEELRTLVKKWQKGCQDALIELMELMMKKFPDKQNMDYAEMLSMLKIPPMLVGYDAENDCFTTPEDSNIILSKFNCL